MVIIGRKNEIKILKEALTSSQAELIAMYGRRRVGKTFLIRNVYEKKMLFEFSGIKEASLELQLENFAVTLSTVFNLNIEIATPKSWLQAFRVLIQLLEERLNEQKQVIFFDEFPWIDSPRSNFLAAFDHFWNSWASKKNNLVVVICGSAASWMIQNVVANKGGLHNRLTRRLRLLPFDLNETEQFLQAQHVTLDYYQLLQLYMLMGGIPHYLKEVKPGESVTQIIDRLCFTNEGLLRDEFKSLYIALFDNAEKHLQIVRTLAAKPSGLTRNELMTVCRMSSGGSLTKILDELLESGFILGYLPFQKNSKDTIYKLSDEYSIFYIKFIENSKAIGTGTWLSKSQSTAYKAWSGLAFENICLKHVSQIKKAMSIAGIYVEPSIWRHTPKDGSEGTQIDLLFDRNDNCINLFEIKFSLNPYVIDKKYANELRQKQQIFALQTKTRKAIFMTMFTTFGVQVNEHFLGTVQQQLTMDALFGE